jgi:ATP-dependent protease Clp ATPase subunit
MEKLEEKTNEIMSDHQKETLSDITRIFQIFKASNCAIRAHFIVTGPSGSGKSHNISAIAKENELNFVEINAAQLTKEGTAGNSLTKAMAPLGNTGGKPTICFIDEFDKLFISGNNNNSLAHETTNGVQNEFLKVLESNKASIAGDYGKYVDIPVEKVLFVFAGAFNGEPDITIDRLRDFGIKTEFIGRVGLVYNLEKLTLDQLLYILKNSVLLEHYVNLHDGVDKEEIIKKISSFIEATYEQNTLGARLVNTLIHQYFIKKGKLNLEQAKEISFQKKLSF